MSHYMSRTLILKVSPKNLLKKQVFQNLRPLTVRVLFFKTIVLDMAFGKPVVLVPAYNEQAHILRLLKELKRIQAEGGIGHVLIVDDGSKDKTSELANRFMEAYKLDGSIIRLEQNQGKGMAFYQGAKHYFEAAGKKANETVMIALDADIWEVTAEKLEKLVAPLGKKTKHKGREFQVEMTVGNPIFTFNNSGERALLLGSLKPFFIRPSLGREMMIAGYGLEPLLNYHYSRSPDIESGELPRIETVGINFKKAPASSSPKRPGRKEIDRERLMMEFVHGSLQQLYRENIAGAAKLQPKNRRKTVLARLKQERKPTLFTLHKREYFAPTIRRIR